MQMRTIQLPTGNRGIALAAAWMLCTSLSGCAVRPAAKESIPSDRRLPKEVVAYLSIRNVREFKSRWSKTQFAQMLADESLGDFRNDFLLQATQASQELCDRLGVSHSELLSIPEGELAFAGIVRPGGILSGVVLLDFGSQHEMVHKLTTRCAAGLGNGQFHCRVEKIGNVDIVSYQTRPADDTDHPRDAVAWFIKETMLVVGNDPTTLKEVLSRWDGKHESTLRQHHAYRSILGRCCPRDSSAQLTWFVDPATLLQMLAEGDRQDTRQARPTLDLLPVIGVDQFKGAGGVFEMDQGEFDSVSRTFVMLERAPCGIVNLFQFETSAQAPPRWLSSDWTSYQAFNWNTDKAYAAFESLTDQLIKPGVLAEQIQHFAENPASDGIHLKKDLIDQFTGAVHVVELDGPNRVETAGDKTPGVTIAPGTLLAMQVKDAAAMKNTLSKIAGLGVLKFIEREFQGQTYYDIEFPAVYGADGSSGSNRSGMAVAQDHLLFASDVRLLQHVLAGVGRAELLCNCAAYQRVARRFPPQTAYIGFNRQDVQMKSLFDLLKTAPPGLVPGLEKLDFSKLPDASLLKKHLSPTGSYMESDAQGLTITSFCLREDAK